MLLLVALIDQLAPVSLLLDLAQLFIAVAVRCDHALLRELHQVTFLLGEKELEGLLVDTVVTDEL